MSGGASHHQARGEDSAGLVFFGLSVLHMPHLSGWGVAAGRLLYPLQVAVEEVGAALGAEGGAVARQCGEAVLFRHRK